MSMVVRVPEATYRAIRQLAGGAPLHTVVTEAVEMLRRRRLLEQANAAFAALRQDPAAWEEERREREDWDRALDDDLGDD